MLDYEITDGDIRISGGDVATVSGAQATRQRLEQKFKLWRGEWFLDVNAGFPWIEEILGQRPAPQVVRSLVFDVVQSDPGIRTVENLELEQDSPQRRLTIRFRARLTNGDTDDMEITV